MKEYLIILSLFLFACDSDSIVEKVKQTSEEKPATATEETANKTAEKAKTKKSPLSPKAQAILENVARAMGTKHLQHIDSYSQSSSIEIPMADLKGSMTVLSAGYKIYIASEMAGVEEKSAFDGSNAWSINPTSGRRDLNGAEKLFMQSKCLNYLKSPAKFYSITLEDSEVFNGCLALKLKYTKQGLDPFYEFIDPETSLSLGRRMTQVDTTGKHLVTIMYKQFRTHKIGFKYPVSLIQKSRYH